jgi:murein L,D-transpeptidase YafK
MAVFFSNLIFALMKRITVVLLIMIIAVQMQAQSAFMTGQRMSAKVAGTIKQREDSLKKQLAAMNISWPVKQIYVRSFKYDSQLEVWVRDKKNEPFKLFKTYKVCALSGALGPKRIEGDYQVPEGFYYINEFNPKSNYHMSLGLNYPNASDQLLSDSVKPGNDIYIHGSCVTVGCIPIQDTQIEELYLLASYAHEQGQDFIPVHIFPIRYNVDKSRDFLVKTSKDDQSYQRFSARLKEVFDYFEQNKKLPLISINKKGEYIPL